MQPHIMTQAHLTTVHSNSWECPILSLSQLLSDTLSDLISDTRSALLRDSLRWEADKEEGSNSDQNHCCHLGSCLLCSHTICYSLLEYSLCTVTRWTNCSSFYWGAWASTSWTDHNHLSLQQHASTIIVSGLRPPLYHQATACFRSWVEQTMQLLQ